MARGPQSLGIPSLTSSAIPGALPLIAETPVAAPGATAMLGLADRIGQLTAGMQRNQDIAAREAGATAGTIAGEQAPGTSMEGGGVIYRTAFNQAALETGARRLEITARDQLDTLSKTHATDPASFAMAAQAWRDGVAGTVPDGPVRVRFQQQFDAIARPYVNQVTEAQRKQVADQALATWDEALPRRIAALTRAAGLAAVDPAAAADLAREEDATLADLARLGPREAFTLGGRAYGPDPTRTGALTVAQMQRQVRAIEAERTEAAVIGAFRAGPKTEAWIDEWEKRETGGGARAAGWIGAQAEGGRALAAPQDLAARLPADVRRITLMAARESQVPELLALAMIGLESGGRADATSPAGARGAAQIMPETAARPGIPGLEPLPPDAIGDPARAIPWAMRYFAGLRERFGGDTARALAAYNAGMGRVETAEAKGGALPTETRDYLATLLPAAGTATTGDGTSGLPPDQVRAIARTLRSELAAETRARAELQRAARADLDPKLKENDAAISVTGNPVHRLDDAELVAAGYDVAAVRASERAGQYRFQATTEIRGANTPADVERIASRFAPGTDLFAADPARAVALIRDAERRGVQIQHADLAQQLADLKAQAEMTGTAGRITPDQGRAAGLTPEAVSRANADLEQTAELARLRRDAVRMTGQQQQEAMARLDFAGQEAAENQARLRALSDGWAERDRQIKADPTGYVLAGSATGQALIERVAKGDFAALPTLIDLLDSEQGKLGVATDKRQPMPKLLAQAITDQVLRLPTDAERLSLLDRMLVTLPDLTTRRSVLDAMGEAGVPEGLRIAAAVSPRIGGPRAAILASELGADLTKLNVPPALKKNVAEMLAAEWATTGWFSQAPIGAMRRTQAELTGNAAFTTAAAADLEVLTKAATVRAIPTGSLTSAMAQQVIADLHGGLATVDTGQVKAVVPKDTDGKALAAGLQARLEATVQSLLPGSTPGVQAARLPLLQGVWTDAGAPDRFAFYPTGSPLPLSLNGAPLIVTLADALAAPAATLRPVYRDDPPRPGAPGSSVMPGFSPTPTAPR